LVENNGVFFQLIENDAESNKY